MFRFKDFLVEVFPFTRPKTVYYRLFSQSQLLAVDGFVVLTSTAHPAAVLAARPGPSA